MLNKIASIWVVYDPGDQATASMADRTGAGVIQHKARINPATY